MIRQPTILYEVYDKRLLHQPHLGDLPVLDRDTNVKRARASARAWGGVVVRAECRVLRTRHPMVREILAWTLVYVAPPKRLPQGPVGGVTLRALRGKFHLHGRMRSRFDQRKPKPPPTE
jgi:hypothetical protein